MELSSATIGLGAAALAATTAYLDAKFHIRHDLRQTSRQRSAAGAIEYVTQAWKNDRLLLSKVIEDRATDPATRDRIFLIYPSDGRQWTYRQFWEDVCRVGNWLVAEFDVWKGELVALNGSNSPEYLLAWYGLDSIGACPAFINCNLTGKPLVHSVELAKTRFMITDQEVSNLVEPMAEEFSDMNTKVIYYGPRSFSQLPFSSEPPDASRRSNIDPTALRGLIYTSGTTGLPKGVVVATGREILIAHSMAVYLDLKHEDRFYTCMPLYHSAAHALCVNASILAGSSVILGKKFSHSTLWPDINVHGATHLHYVGELCRYLLAAPPRPHDKTHKVRMAWGNGLRPDIWNEFRTRFNIPVINEIYAATDGMGISLNYNRGDFTLGCIGLRGPIWHFLRDADEVRTRIDVDSQELIRDPVTGFAKKCTSGEAGEVLHKVDPANPEASFRGYFRNQDASRKRFVRDVFEKGDMWFRSGDMTREDRDGRLTFVDRLGDTFRWKSENVATNEVEETLCHFPGIVEMNVYGVQVPHADGRAGCAAIVLENNDNDGAAERGGGGKGGGEKSFDWKGFGKFAVEKLPRYAVPIFVRVTREIQITGTMKLQKGKMRNEGCDVEAVERAGDVMFWLRPASDSDAGGDGVRGYERFGREEWDQVQKGGVKL